MREGECCGVQSHKTVRITITFEGNGEPKRNQTHDRSLPSRVLFYNYHLAKAADDTGATPRLKTIHYRR